MAAVTYREVRPDGKRLFFLNDNALSIKGSNTFKSSFELTIDLKDADPNVLLLWVRPGLCFSLLGLTALFATAAVVTRASGWATDENIADLVMWGFAGLMAILALASAKKIKFTHFKNKTGVVLFDVAQSGPDKNKYDLFIASIISSIASRRDS